MYWKDTRAEACARVRRTGFGERKRVVTSVVGGFEALSFERPVAAETHAFSLANAGKALTADEIKDDENCVCPRRWIARWNLGLRRTLGSFGAASSNFNFWRWDAGICRRSTDWRSPILHCCQHGWRIRV